MSQVGIDDTGTDLLGRREAWTLVASVAALGVLAAATNLAAVEVRLLAPMFAVVFLAGIFGGPLVGFATGAVAMTLQQLVFGVGIYSLAPIFGMAEVGGLAGFLARIRFRRRTAERPLPWLVAAAVAGVALTFAFSFFSDVTEWALVAAGLVPAAHTPYVGGVVWAGLTFNAGVALVNGPLLAGGVWGTVQALEWLRDRDPTGSVVREVIARVDALAWDGTASWA